MRLSVGSILRPIGRISIHASLRDATIVRLAAVAGIVLISIHASLRDATSFSIRASYSSIFQSTHPCGMRRRTDAVRANEIFPDFNPRIPAGCDFFFHTGLLQFDISIHASLRDATAYRRCPSQRNISGFQSTHPCGMRLCPEPKLPFVQKMISIHASLRDATRHTTASRASRAALISIHASLRDATQLVPGSLQFGPFQSTHPCGMRQTEPDAYCRRKRFQSTHPCGMRLHHSDAIRGLCNFNPRIPAGCDARYVADELLHGYISIHASLRDATRFEQFRLRPVRHISIHASLRDATVSAELAAKEDEISIHASLRDATVFI